MRNDRRLTIRCFLAGLGRTPAEPALALTFVMPFPFPIPLTDIPFTYASATGGTPFTGVPIAAPSSLSLFFPLDRSTLIGVVVAVLEGVATIAIGPGICTGGTIGLCSCLTFEGAVEPGLGTVEPGLGTAEPGRGIVDPGRGTVDIGLGVPTGFGVDDITGIWGVAEAPLRGTPPAPAGMGWG